VPTYWIALAFAMIFPTRKREKVGGYQNFCAGKSMQTAD
jgi:hypothetical protein